MSVDAPPIVGGSTTLRRPGRTPLIAKFMNPSNGPFSLRVARASWDAMTSRLVESGSSVVVLDVLHPQVHTSTGRPPRLPEEVTLLPVDITGASEWTVLRLVRPTVIVHLAAETGTGQSLVEASQHGRVNVLGTTEMLDALLRAQVIPEHIVLSSSRAVYGEGEWITRSGVTFSPGRRTHAAFLAGQWNPVGPDGEVATPRPSVAGRTSPHPTSIYGATKLTQELVLSASSRQRVPRSQRCGSRMSTGLDNLLRTRTPVSSRFSLRWLSGVMSWLYTKTAEFLGTSSTSRTWSIR